MDRSREGQVALGQQDISDGSANGLSFSRQRVESLGCGGHETFRQGYGTPVTRPTDEALIERIGILLQGILSKGALSRSVSPSEPLPDAGVSSMDMVSLMLAIEAEFELFIAPEDVNAKNFRSIASIASMVGILLDRPPPSE